MILNRSAHMDAPASARAGMRTIYLPSVLNDDVYSTLQLAIQDSRGENLVVDATYLDVIDSRLIALLRRAMSALDANHHSLTVVKTFGVGRTPTPVTVSELEVAQSAPAMG
jgi:anti-anti-sigma regulatory factor